MNCWSSRIKGIMYNLLPFQFERRHDGVLLTNDIGEYIIISPEDFTEFYLRKLDKTEVYYNLKSKYFLYDQSLDRIIDTIATRFRSRHRFLFDRTSLHMFVVTLRCNQQCEYCHASSEDYRKAEQYDMSDTIAKKAVDFAFQTPSPYIKIEFQGGEPLLNFNVIKLIIEYSTEINKIHKKGIEFVICTNLLVLTKEHIDFFKKYNVDVSTSLDGSESQHDSFRVDRFRNGTFSRVIDNIKIAKKYLDSHKVCALLTVTPKNINSLRKVIDLYIDQDFNYIFIRPLHNFGNAYKSESLEYSMQDFINAYKDALKYIIELNVKGVTFSEVYASILLSKILTPFSSGFVDLQSPTGAGLSGIIYDTNGDVFIADEGRMLHRTNGDKRFCIGHVSETYQKVMANPFFEEVIRSSVLDATPGCSWCVYKPYCGSNPIKNYFFDGDLVGCPSKGKFCQLHREIFDELFSFLLESNEKVHDVFWSWISRISYKKIAELELLESSGAE